MEIVDDNKEYYGRELRISYEPPLGDECLKELTPFTVRYRIDTPWTKVSNHSHSHNHNHNHPFFGTPRAARGAWRGDRSHSLATAHRSNAPTPHS